MTKSRTYHLIFFILWMMTITSAFSQTIAMTVTAEDKSHNPVTDLGSNNISVMVDGASATVSSIKYSGNTPVDWVLAVDCSNSMRREELWRPAIAGATRSLISLMKERGDRVAIAVVSESPVHILPFTSDEQRVIAMVNGLHPEGATALYDSFISLADYLPKAVSGRRQIIWLISDGEDNMSQSPADKAIQRFGSLNIPVIISLMENVGTESGGRSKMEKLANNSGGTVFIMESIRQSTSIAEMVALFSKKEYEIVLAIHEKNSSHKLEIFCKRAGVKLLDTKRFIPAAALP